jgi:hypothetical protein
MYKCPKCSADYADKEEYDIYHTCKKKDKINPDHYKIGGIETIDIIRAKLSKEAFEGYCTGNIIKYITRYNNKNGVEDVKKASVYAAWLAESLERGER